MLNLSQLRENVYDIVAPLLSNIQLIYNYQSDVKPKDPATGKVVDKYSTFRFRDTKEVGMQKSGPVDNDGNVKVHHVYSIALNMQVVGQNSYEDAVNLHVKMLRPSVIDAFMAVGLHYYDRTTIRDIPKLNSTGYEDKSVFDFNFYVVVEDIDNQSWIEFIEIETTVKNPADQIVIQETTTLDIVP